MVFWYILFSLKFADFMNNSSKNWIINGPRPTHPTLALRWGKEVAHEDVVSYFE
jgi:hypothetical protein